MLSIQARAKIIAVMSQQRILVVDDDKSIVKVVRSYLEQAGYDVLTAYDGESALHMLRSERPDLLVLDLMLPEADQLPMDTQSIDLGCVGAGDGCAF